ncbi:MULTISPECIES: TRAP transporter large permease [Acutalibacteraceae]|uniref:TRAP transporter large permease n=1 Tax=Acutalibacteraceae TaxID=3082771 RepID=UPI001FA9AB3E|nr:MULTISPECIES: TRAP transporter large permease [Acutalibacteraceae]
MSSLAFLPILLVFVLYFAGIPIVYALLGSTFFYFAFIDTTSPMDLILQKVLTSSQSFNLLAIPFFVMAGSIMNYSGISEKMMDFAEVLTGHMRGGLAQVNVLLSMLMGGCSGSANADAAMEAKMLEPQMEERGYSKAFSTAITAASSAATPVIPPGVNLIVYAVLASCSLGRMFAAGYIPGILMGLSLMVAVAYISKKRNYQPSRGKRATLGEIGRQALVSFWGLFFPFGIILGMRAGMFTPSEGGAIAVLYAVIIGKFVYKKLNFRRDFIPIMKESIAGSAAVVMIMVSASVFGYYLTWVGIPQMVAVGMTTLTQNKYVMLLLCNLILLIMGMFLEGGAALMIIAPLLVPVVTAMGVDPVHFGMICIVNIMLGGLTPPFGSMMFTTCGITGCKISDFVRECWIFMFALLVVLIIITFVPFLSLVLPNLIYGVQG